MTREAYIEELVQMGVPYSMIDAILQYSGNKPNLEAYQNLQRFFESSHTAQYVR